MLPPEFDLIGSAARGLGCAVGYAGSDVPMLVKCVERDDA